MFIRLPLHVWYISKYITSPLCKYFLVPRNSNSHTVQTKMDDGVTLMHVVFLWHTCVEFSQKLFCALFTQNLNIGLEMWHSSRCSSKPRMRVLGDKLWLRETISEDMKKRSFNAIALFSLLNFEIFFSNRVISILKIK